MSDFLNNWRPPSRVTGFGKSLQFFLNFQKVERDILKIFATSHCFKKTSVKSVINKLLFYITATNKNTLNTFVQKVTILYM